MTTIMPRYRRCTTGITDTFSGIKERMKRIYNLLFILVFLTVFSCKNNIEQNHDAVNVENNIHEVLEINRIREERIKKSRELSGIVELTKMNPQDLKDKYFRILNYPPFNKPFEIIEVTNVSLDKPIISKRTVQFDIECNFVSGKKKLNEHCFNELDFQTKEIKELEMDSLFQLLDRTEFWNLRKETYNLFDIVIYDGTYIEMAGYKAKRNHLSDSLSKYQNVIERQIPERFIGISMINDYINELYAK